MLYKKSSSSVNQYISLLKEYYHTSTTKALLKAISEDFLISTFLRSGSGLATSAFKGILSKLFIKSGYPVLIGKRTRIVHFSNIVMGNYIWIKDDVSIVANGRLKIGNDFVIGERSSLWSHEKGLSIGNKVGIGKGCYIAQLGGSIKIGDNVLIADSVKIYSLNHKYEDTTSPILHQGYEECTIEIEDNVWIGSGVVIFNNVTIGSGSVIGANTVVTKFVPPNVVFAGVPGKIIKRLE